MRIALVGTGGTISSRQTEHGVTAQMTAADLLASLDPGALPAGVEVDTYDVGTRPSFALTLDDMAHVAASVLDRLEDGYDAAVVLHGTDSMEETAFLADVLHAGDAPVVVTGAQRPADAPAADGPANIATALASAARARDRGIGVAVAFDGRLWRARGVRKVHTEEPAAFAGAPLDLDRADGPGPRSTIGGARRAVADRGLPRVDVVACVPGGDGAAIRHAAESGARAVVVQATGIGNVGPDDCGAVAAVIDSGVPVVVSSRVAAGPVRPVYAGGGGADLARAGALFCGRLSPWQARILLAALIATDPDSPSAHFDAWLDKTDSR